MSGTASSLVTAGALIGGKYRLDALIGEGGMGSVWAATKRERSYFHPAIESRRAGDAVHQVLDANALRQPRLGRLAGGDRLQEVG